MKAVEVLMEHGVPEERIIFINLVSQCLATVTPVRISLSLTLLDLRPRGPQNLLRKVPSTTCGMPLSTSTKPSLTVSYWIDNWLDRQGVERKGIHYPWLRRLWRAEVSCARITHRSTSADSRSPASGTVCERVVRLVFHNMCA